MSYDIIYSNHHLKVICNSEKKDIFKIELAYPNPVLLLSLRKFIKGSTCSDDYLLFTFKAYSVEMFTSYKKKIGIHNVTNMVATLGGQVNLMIGDYSVTFLGFNTENIIVVDDCKFLCLDVELMREIDEQNNVTIFTPFSSGDFFFSPEIKCATKLPLVLHYKTSYFSFGCLLLYTLLCCDNSFYKEYLIESLSMQQIFKKYLENHPIKETKLYWLIFRCLVQEPEKRSIIFI
jgi:hypothetical protein